MVGAAPAGAYIKGLTVSVNMLFECIWSILTIFVPVAAVCCEIKSCLSRIIEIINCKEMCANS